MTRRPLLVFLLATPAFAGSPRSLVPAGPGTTPSYWCTWTAQGNRVSPESVFGAAADVRHDRIALS